MILLILLICMNTSESLKIQTLDPTYQVAYQSVEIEEEISQSNQCFNFGLWSMYNPLSSISQVCPFGIFGSNCYQLLIIIDIINDEIIFMYQDCLDNEQNQKKKYIKFVKDDGEQKIYEIQIKGNEYESFQCFLEIISWSINQQFEIVIITQQQLQLWQKIDEIKKPFGQYFQITFGGSLIVQMINSTLLLVNREQNQLQQNKNFRIFLLEQQYKSYSQKIKQQFIIGSNM